RGLRRARPGAAPGRRPARHRAARTPHLAVRLASAQHVPSAAGGPGPGIRLDAPPGGPAAPGHVLAVWEELTDTAWDYGIVPDDALTPRKAAARIVRLGRLDQADEAKQADDAASASVHRVAGAVEQVLFAPDPQAPPGLADDVRRLRLALRARAGRRTRLRALLAPRSAIRAVWALTDRATTVRVRTAERWASLVRRPKPSPSGQRGG
ncbi:transglutaminase, partial [Streptomyces sp. NPDC059477]